MLRPQEYLAGASKNAVSTSKKSPTLTKRGSLEQNETNNAQNIVPAPTQSNQRDHLLSPGELEEATIKKLHEEETSQSKKDMKMQESFQNRLIKNKIHQRLGQDDDGLAS